MPDAFRQQRRRNPEPGSANQVLVLRRALLGDRFETLADLRHVGADVVDARERGERLEAEDPFEERRRAVADRAVLVLASAFRDQPALDETRDDTVDVDAADAG